MKRDDIIHMAQEIAMEYSKAERFQTWTHDFMMQRLMELVAAEREACAKLFESREGWLPSETVAAAIRARGNT
jgi:hypothetical protein